MLASGSTDLYALALSPGGRGLGEGAPEGGRIARSLLGPSSSPLGKRCGGSPFPVSITCFVLTVLAWLLTAGAAWAASGNLVGHGGPVKAVVVSEDGVRLQGFVTLVPNIDVTGADLITHAKGVLPSYAVPDHIEIRPSFEKTSTGKINRRVLAKEAP